MFSLPFVICMITYVLDLVNAAHRSPHILTSSGVINVTLASSVPVYIVDDKYLSFTMDSGVFNGHLRGFNTSSVKLQNVARGMGKTFLRVGGTDADRIVFRDPVPGFGLITGPNYSKMSWSSNRNVHIQDFDDLYLFSKAVGWEYSFDLNILLRNGSQWNSTNARAVLDYAVSKGYVFNLELGNEPDFYVRSKNIQPSQVGHDFVALRGIMSTYPTFKNVQLMGPSVTQGCPESYIADYYSSGSDLHPPEMLDPTWLDSAAGVVNRSRDVISKYSKGTQTLWLAETGLTWSRSASDTSGFIAGFMWMDKLGISAVNGASLLARQTFNGLMDEQYNPTPEYWLSYLYKQLVGTKVLRLASTENNHYFRIYAHCSLTHDGGIAFYYVNLYRSIVNFSIPEYSGQSYEMYSLTVGGNGTMSSSIVNLNGEPMQMDGDYFPLFEPVTSMKWPVSVPQLSYGFFVLPNTDLDACKS